MKSFYDVFNISGDPSVSAAHCQLLPSGPFCHFVTFPHSMGNPPFQGSHILSTSMNYVKSADTARRVPTKYPEHLANCAQLDQPDGFHDFGSFCFHTVAFLTPDTAQPVPTKRTEHKYFYRYDCIFICFDVS